MRPRAASKTAGMDPIAMLDRMNRVTTLRMRMLQGESGARTFHVVSPTATVLANLHTGSFAEAVMRFVAFLDGAQAAMLAIEHGRDAEPTQAEIDQAEHDLQQRAEMGEES